MISSLINKIILITLLLLSFQILSKPPATIKQCKINKKILNTIAMVETRNRNLIGDTKYKYNYSVGYHQIRIKTAEWIWSKDKYKHFLIELLRSKFRVSTRNILLIKYFNTYTAKSLLNYICKYHKSKYKITITSYNTGWGASEKIRLSAGERYWKEYLKFY